MPQDYHSFAELDQAFDLVMSLEVLEHVRPDTALDLVASCRDATRPGGLVLMSVPNVYTPAVQLEFTHETAYHYADLGAILTWAGLEVVAAARLFTRPGSRLMLHRLASPVHRLLGIDYCQTVNILARRPEAASL
jgi:SAM-dependent methyltransferase